MPMPGANEMRRLYVRLAFAAVVALGVWASVLPAGAAPPTVTPSPGYDARLQEQHAAQTYYPAPVYEPVARYHRPPRHHVRRVRDGMH